MCHQFDYCSERHAQYFGMGRPQHHGGCCCVPGYPQRHFATRKELIRELEECVKNLQAEARGLVERIDELKKDS